MPCNIKYDDDFLILELQRFKKENNRTPTTSEMSIKNGYPSYSAYVSHFGSFNNSLKKAKLELNNRKRIKKSKLSLKKRETCPKCASVSVNYRKRKEMYLCKFCGSYFNEPIIVERLHNNMGKCIDNPV